MIKVTLEHHNLSDEEIGTARFVEVSSDILYFFGGAEDEPPDVLFSARWDKQRDDMIVRFADGTERRGYRLNIFGEPDERQGQL